MNRLTGLWLNGIVWLVAIMLPVQPIAASHCSCCQGIAIKSTKDREAATHHHCRSAGRCCSSRAESGTVQHSTSSPCHCPSNCPCHLQHLPKVAVKIQDVKIEPNAQVGLLSSDVIPHLVREQAQRSVSPVLGSLVSVSALERCAALCRYTT